MFHGAAPALASDEAVRMRRDGATVAMCAVLLVITALAWAQVVASALTSDPMRGMAMTPTVFNGLAYVLGWTVMMVGMMLPSALPMIALYAAVERSTGGPVRRLLSVSLFTLVYLGVWAATGVPMYFVSTLLATSTAGALGYGVAAVLVVAGLFQLTPFKQFCLRHCRSPLGFFIGHWGHGGAGWRRSLAMGWAHALYCLGCCWALMIVLVVAGAMGLPWVLLIAAVVAAEKLLPAGSWIARGIGVTLVLLGLVVAMQPGLAMALRGAGHPM